MTHLREQTKILVYCFKSTDNLEHSSTTTSIIPVIEKNWNSSKLYPYQYYCMVAPLRVNETSGEKARLELHEGAAYCFEQIREAATQKITTLWPLKSNLINWLSFVWALDAVKKTFQVY